MNPVERKKAEGKLSSFVQSLQKKNGSSPGVASGSAPKGNHNQNVKEKSQSKRNKKNKGKGQGKANQNNNNTGTPEKKGGLTHPCSPSPGKASEGMSSFSRSPERQPPFSPPCQPQQSWNPRWVHQGWGQHGQGGKPSDSGRGAPGGDARCIVGRLVFFLFSWLWQAA